MSSARFPTLAARFTKAVCDPLLTVTPRTMRPLLLRTRFAANLAKAPRLLIWGLPHASDSYRPGNHSRSDAGDLACCACESARRNAACQADRGGLRGHLPLQRHLCRAHVRSRDRWQRSDGLAVPAGFPARHHRSKSEARKRPVRSSDAAAHRGLAPAAWLRAP